MEMGQAWDIIWRDEVTAKDRVCAKALSIVKKVNFKNGINTEHTKPFQEEKWRQTKQWHNHGDKNFVQVH